jgi:putative membrane protein
MKSLLTRWFLSAVALYVSVWISQATKVPALYLTLKAPLATLVVVAVLAIVNALIRPLVLFLTLPLSCLTLGLFTFVVNGLMFWLVGSLGVGLEVKTFWAALFGSIVMGILSGIANSFVRKRGDRE